MLQSVGRPPLQYQFSSAIPLVAGTGNTSCNVNVTVPWPIKKIKFDFAYQMQSTVGNGPITLLATSDICYNDIVGTLNLVKYVSGANVIYHADCLASTKAFEYVFREPIRLSGSVGFTFTNLYATNIASGNVLIHMEFLSDG